MCCVPLIVGLKYDTTSIAQTTQIYLNKTHAYVSNDY